jgi:hypothetical protein
MRPFENREIASEKQGKRPSRTANLARFSQFGVALSLGTKMLPKDQDFPSLSRQFPQVCGYLSGIYIWRIATISSNFLKNVQRT